MATESIAQPNYTTYKHPLCPVQRQRIDSGLCAWCGADKGTDGTTLACRSCASKSGRRTKEIRESNKRKGLCIDCRNPRGENATTTRCRPCAQKSARRINKSALSSRLKRAFNITVDQFNQLLAAQNGVCAICGAEETVRRRSGDKIRLAVDHCHVTGKVRALLCSNCNKGLGSFKDSPELLRKGADYLEQL